MVDDDLGLFDILEMVYENLLLWTIPDYLCMSLIYGINDSKIFLVKENKEFRDE